MGDYADPGEPRRKRQRMSGSASATGSLSSHHNNIQVIDLTDDSPPADMDSDEALARRLQAELDAEDQAFEAPTAPPKGTSADEDEALARALQAQYDAEDADQPPPPPSGPPPSAISNSNANSNVNSTVNAITNGGPSAQSSIAIAKDTFNELLAIKCIQCGHSTLPASEGEILMSFKSIYSTLTNEYPSIATTGIHKCGYKVCSMQSCLGCGQGIAATETSHQLGTFQIHCQGHRLPLICILLCGYDIMIKHHKPSHARTAHRKSSAAVAGPRPVGVGRSGSTASSGIGYGSEGYAGGYQARRGGKQKSHQGKAEVDAPASISDLRDEDDKLSAHIMQALSDLLPSLDRSADPFDATPPQALSAFLAQSCILAEAAELLRNNSLEDVTARTPLYLALVRFVSALAGHPDTSILVYHERPNHPADHGLLEVVQPKKGGPPCNSNDTTPSLAMCMKDLSQQCMMMLRDLDASDEDDNAIHLYHAMQSMAENIQANADSIQSSSEDPTAWLKELAVGECPDNDIMTGFCFQRDANNMNVVLPKRMKRIRSDITTLQTSLPDGIFVRYAETRPDCMKALIVGPQDTPYANGLFEFDLLCPHDYPNKPPTMQLKTTGGGTVRFNPNLYANGKVCLSLLGTWGKEDWKPQESTILQVLISIQAMIFCDEPYTNEPAYNHHRGTEQSKVYNRQTQAETVEVAMLGWLEQGGKRKTVWDEVVKKHFDGQKTQIMEAVTSWKGDWPQGNHTHFAGTGHTLGSTAPPPPPGVTMNAMSTQYGYGYGYGTQQYGYGTPQYGTPQYGTPQYGTPQYGTQYGTSPGWVGTMPGAFYLQPGFYPPVATAPPASLASVREPGRQSTSGAGKQKPVESLADLIRQLREAIPELKNPRRAPRKVG